MHCKQYNTNQFVMSQQLGDHRPNDGRYPVSVCRPFLQSSAD